MLLPSRAAERVIDELGITSIDDLQLLDAIAWERGATVLYKPLHGAEARLVALGRRSIITISSLVEDPRRRRFGVAHELGHLEMHRRRSNMFLCSSQDINDWGERKSDRSLEREANEFAAALLLPERFFASQCKGENPSLDFISKLAMAFNVSLTATALRYLRFCDEVCAVVFSQDGYIKWFRCSDQFEYVRDDVGLYIDVRVKLDPSSIAASLFDNHTLVQSSSKRIDASVWFEPGHYRSDATIVEQSWAMPRYNAVLTLLWVDDDIEDQDSLWTN
jgi:hypothetical protein